MSRVLVTGANGYIGRHVVTALLDMGHEVIAVDFRFDGVDKRATTLKTDIFSGAENMYEQLGRPDVCIHLAWRDGFIHNSVNHVGDLSNHFLFLKTLMDGGLKHLAVMGSMHEIGYWEGPITADTPCNPLSQYGIAKNALRQSVMLLAKDRGVNIYWLRAYYIVGDDERSSSIFGKITAAVKDGKTEFPFTSGKNKYDFISLDELARQIATASTQTTYSGVLNLCTGKPVSLADRVEQFIKDHHYPIKLVYGAFPDRPYDSPGVWGDATLINKIMGYDQ